MSNEEHKKDLYEHIAKMDLEGLHEYYGSAKSTGRTVDIFGVGVIFLMILFFNTFTLIGGAIVIYIAAQVSVGIRKTLDFIELRIAELDK